MITIKNWKNIKTISFLAIAILVTYSIINILLQSHNTHVINLATTSSLYDSGLLPSLTNLFYEQTGIKVNIIVSDSGQAFILAKNQDVDTIITHAPDKEIEFVKQNYGIKRYPLFYNSFIIVGPPNDPANIQSSTTIIDVFKKIYFNKKYFVSRADMSGTHLKEMEIWSKSNLQPQNQSWYLKAGCGMADALRLASEKGAYTITDIATFIIYRSKLNLIRLFQNDYNLINIYSIIELNPKKLSKSKYSKAKQFIQFLNSATSKQFIQEFGKKQYASQLFYVYNINDIEKLYY